VRVKQGVVVGAQHFGDCAASFGQLVFKGQDGFFAVLGYAHPDAFVLEIEVVGG
jgi:hypothetical protein